MLFQRLKQHDHNFGDLKMNFGIHHKIMLLSALIIFVSFTYDSLFHLIIGLLHGIFESVEYVLDGCIEHLFDTGTHKTQVIVFYILVLFISYGFYRIYCFIPRCCRRIKTSLVNDKAEVLSYWHSLSFLKKLKYSSIVILILGCWFFLGF